MSLPVAAMPAPPATPAATSHPAPGCPEDIPADLHYVDGTEPGFTRRPAKDGGFDYYDTDGKRIREAETLARIRSLAIPPAYTDVWICADPRGHLQATGRDARGRKQYRYHPRWREARDANKYERMLAFAAALPKIRARVARDLARPAMPREKVLATVVRLLDTTLIRVGNVDYARENRSYGLTTLRDRHVKVSATEVRFRFRGKSGVEHDVTVHDARIAKIVRRCMDLPGHNLFQYLDSDGTRRTVSSTDINAYLQAIAGSEFSAKDYRTWAGTVFALSALSAREFETQTEARRHIVDIIKDVARRLGNTPAVCRKCYVHPAVLSAYEAGELRLALRSAGEAGTAVSSTRGLKRDEANLHAFLKKALARAGRERRRLAREGRAQGTGGGLEPLLQASRKRLRARTNPSGRPPRKPKAELAKQAA